jgi:hypothetical protein
LADTPRTGNADVDAQDRAVDRKIKSICKGCWIGTFARPERDDYSLEAEREIRKIVGCGAINFR